MPHEKLKVLGEIRVALGVAVAKADKIEEPLLGAKIDDALDCVKTIIRSQP